MFHIIYKLTKSSVATPTIGWNGSKWLLNVTGIDTGRTVCNVNFNNNCFDENCFSQKIITNNGGAAAIEAKATPNFGTDNTPEGMFATPDDYGTSYYFRGTKNLNNNLIFGGHQWKIIRVNGNKTVRVIYNGTCPNDTCTINTTGTNTQAMTSAWNSTNYNDAKYVGYMYGGSNGSPSTVRNGTTSNAATYNQTSTYMKTRLESWYQTNILGKTFENNISDMLFCNDRSVYSGNGYGNQSQTYYKTYNRIVTNKTPTLRCEQKNDRFTVNDTIIGNGALTQPIGLITSDEVAMAGLVVNQANGSNYLNTGQFIATFSPYYSYSSSNNPFSASSFILSISNDGRLSTYGAVQTTYSVRPVINLKSGTRVIGNGSTTTPYRLVE